MRSVGEPSAVSMPLGALQKWRARGAWPAAVATALHSSSIPRMKSLPPGEARIVPTGARIRQVEAASEARNTHFSHIS